MKSSMSSGTPLSRMSSAERSTDWNEPKMSDYLQQKILESSGGMWTAPWRSGLGQTVLGLSTYAPNCIAAWLSDSRIENHLPFCDFHARWMLRTFFSSSSLDNMSLQRNTQEGNIQTQPVDQKLLNPPDGTGAGVYST